MKDLSAFDLQKLNSMTKYPSILTYHELGNKGMLQNSLTEGNSFNGKEVIVTEKVDGTNGRIVAYKGDYMIGSREDILYAKGDRVINPTLGIVDTLKPLAERLSIGWSEDLYVVYSEVYGGNVTSASKQYTNNKQWSFRVFDLCKIASELIESLMNMERNNIASWRDHGGQYFEDDLGLQYFINNYNVERVPYLTLMDGEDIPKSLKKTYDFLKFFSKSKATINSESGKSEGIVVRTQDRSLIRKIRFEDYERTEKRGGF